MKRLVAFVSFITLLAVRDVSAAEAVNFSRDVLPILSENCLSCHGQDEGHRKADLRLDTRDGAIRDNKGVRAVIPGEPEKSELLVRILSKDEDEVMPPPKSHKPPLKAEEVAVLRRWIKEGAVWGKHWSFEKPVKTTLPLKTANPIDAFVRLRLAKEKLAPAPEASRYILLRRASFDLTGLPPTPEEVAAFEKDKSAAAWPYAVKRLLDSPHFGERMAMWWLDAARYADTDGFQADAERSNWPWRDWVVQAFNSNMKFDQFTIEQFAGDLLPNATPEQKLATCFHRNHMTNGEGGRDPEESRVDYVIDRVNTMGTTWLGLTLGCTQCHSHKFDPIAQVDYYSLSAFFNSIDEDGKAGSAAKPYLAYQSPFAARAVTEAQQLVEARKPVEQQARKAAEPAFAGWLAKRFAESRKEHSSWQVLQGAKLESIEGTQLIQQPDGSVSAQGANPNQDDYRFITPVKISRIMGWKLEVLPGADGKFSRGASGEFMLTDVKLQVRRQGASQIRDISHASAVADYSADKKKNNNYGDIKDTLDDDPRNGWTTIGAPKSSAHVAVFELAEPLILTEDEELVFELRQRSTLGDANLAHFRISVTSEAGETVRSVSSSPLEDLAKAAPADVNLVEAKLRNRLFEQFLEDHAPYRVAKSSLDRANRQLAEMKKAAGKLNAMVLAERKQPRDTFVLVRGVWDKHGQKVQPDIIPAIAPWPAGEEKTRLGLARWIVSRENPLTARVIVNHFWQMLYGNGLVKSTEDFGLQGDRPTHPELLDWLAVEFMESGWDVKHLLTLMVTSETYRQSSKVTPELLARDPENRLLARGPRFRLPSWMLRDAALRASGLFNPAVGGPPVRPYQPDGVWEELFMGRFKYEPSEGSAQYRRTLYAFWRRAIAPTFLFDSAQRRVCEVRMPRTNTPLQALTLLNDETYLEASRALASQMLAQPADVTARLQFLSRRVLSRPASKKELVVLRRELDRALAHYRANPTDAEKFLRFGRTEPDTKLNAAELAAYTVVASLTFNLDEAISHE